MDVLKLLKTAYEKGASDLILKTGSPPLLRIYGDLIPTDTTILSPKDTENAFLSIATESERRRFEKDLELDIAFNVSNLCRFRVNVFMQRSSIGVVLRLIPNKVPSIDQLGLPSVLKDISMRPRGLVIITGPAGCGKSTTQAAMLDYRNEHEECHIVTVEEPIEFMHQDKLALVEQREVGRDSHSFSNALKYVLRQDPDVILVGEMRDLETSALAITAAETGHLVLGTLHTTDAVQTVDRVIDVFPGHQQRQIRIQMAANLLAVVSQILVKKKGGEGQVAAFEIMICTPPIKNLIREAKTHQIASHIFTSTSHGMRTINMSLAELVKKDIISHEEAMVRTRNEEDLLEMLGKKGKK